MDIIKDIDNNTFNSKKSIELSILLLLSGPALVMIWLIYISRRSILQVRLYFDYTVETERMKDVLQRRSPSMKPVFTRWGGLSN